MLAFAPLLRADLLLRAALVVGGGLRAPRCTRAAPNGVFVRAFMVAKRRGKLEMGSIEAEVIRSSYWVSAVQGADIHGAGQQREGRRGVNTGHTHAIRQSSVVFRRRSGTTHSVGALLPLLVLETAGEFEDSYRRFRYYFR